jgi:hypothetical protein
MGHNLRLMLILSESRSGQRKPAKKSVEPLGVATSYALRCELELLPSQEVCLLYEMAMRGG